MERSQHSLISTTYLSDLNCPAVPVKAVVHVNRILSVCGSVKDDDTRALRSSVGTYVDIGSNYVACRPEKILEILPAYTEG